MARERITDQKQEVVNRRFRTPESLVNSVLSSWADFSPEQRMAQRERVEGFILKFKDTDRVRAANNLIIFKEGLHAVASAEGQEEVVVMGAKEQKSSYLRDLLKILNREDFDTVGQRLQEVPNLGSMESAKLIVAQSEQGEKHSSIAYFPPLVVEKMIGSFVEAGYIRSSRGKLALSTRGKDSHLGYDALKSVVVAQDILNSPAAQRVTETLSDIEENYALDREKNGVERVELSVNKPSGSILYLSEILIGNSTTDTKFLGKVISEVSSLPKNQKPDAVVVSGLIQGNFKYRGKEQRAGLVDEYSSLDQQFKAAKVVLDKLGESGTSIIYAMSKHDREIARQGTIETMKMLQDKSGHVSYWQEDQMRRSKAWDSIYKFQLDVVLPYCMRSGKRLRSAEEVGELTNGRSKLAEYFMLFEAYRAGVDGRNIPHEYREVVDIKNIPFPGKEFKDFKFVDDLDLLVHTKSRSRASTVTQMIRNNMNLTDATLPQNPIAVPHTISRQMAAEGMQVPNAIVITGQQEMVGVGGPDGNWVMSTGALLDPARLLIQRGSRLRAGTSPQLRQIASRRLLPRPSAEAHEHTDDGRHIITIFNEKLREKSYATEDRFTIVQLTDWQTGSTTARPDLQMKYLHLATKIMRDRPTYIIADGDIVHGDIYSKHKTENAHMGLIATSDQQTFVLNMLERGMDHLSGEDLSNLVKFMSVPGNHEYENGLRDNSNVPNEYLVNFVKNLLKNKGIDPRGRAQGYGSFQTSRGDHLRAWTGIENDLGGYGVVFKHKLLEKGAKGQGGIPVFQARTLHEGLGSFAKDIDLSLHGHWHHPQYALFGDKLAVVAPALAGWSGFEMDLGYQAVIGGAMIHLGGGKDPQVEFLSAKTLHEYKITDGYFSDKNLRAEGFRTDRDFDPARHGYAQSRTDSNTRMSALQKALWAKTDEVVWQADSKI